MKWLLLPAIGIALLALAACAQEVEEELEATPTPTAMTSPSPAPTATASPTPSPTPMAPAPPVPLEQGAPITEQGIYVVEVASGQLWKVAEFSGGPWSPDGKTLMIKGCCIGKGGIDLIDMEAGMAVRIFSGDIAIAAWSPDGNQIAFSRYEDGPQGLYLINRDGGGLKQLSDRGTWTVRWSPRGDRMAFQPFVQGGVFPFQGLNLLHLASGEITEIDKAGPFAWSPDGRSLAFSNDSGLYLHDPDTGQRRQLAAGDSSGPILWSPDSSKIAFRFGPRTPMAYGAYAGDPESGVQIFHVMGVEGSREPEPLPPARDLSWSLDGTRLAYLSQGCITGEWDIYSVRPDSSGLKRLTDTPEALKEGVVWSPIDSTVAFSTFDKLMLVDADSQQLRTLAASGRPTIHLHGAIWGGAPWSSNGRYIVFGVGFDHGICD